MFAHGSRCDQKDLLRVEYIIIEHFILQIAQSNILPYSNLSDSILASEESDESEDCVSKHLIFGAALMESIPFVSAE